MKKLSLLFILCLSVLPFLMFSTAEQPKVDGRPGENIVFRGFPIYYTLEGVNHDLSVDSALPLPDGRWLLEGWAHVEGTNAYVSFKGTWDPFSYSLFIVVAAVSTNPSYEPAHSLLRVPSILSNYIEGRSTVDGAWHAGTWGT